MTGQARISDRRFEKLKATADVIARLTILGAGVVILSVTSVLQATEMAQIRLAMKVGEAFTDSILCLKVGATVYSDIAALSAAAGGSSRMADEGLVISFPAGERTFREGTPYVTGTSESIDQLAMPVLKVKDRFYGHTRSLCFILAEISDRKISLDESLTSISVGLPNPIVLGDRGRWALDVVVIDPGHGGKDPGAIGPTGLKEKDIALDVGLRLDKFLKARGIKTVMTRDTDEFIPLAGRTDIANKAGGKLFISIHCNSAKRREAGGMETYFLAPSKTERAMEVALLENEAVRFEESREHYRELTEEAYILMTMTQTTYTNESETLAGMVQELVAPRAGLKDRGVDQAGFYVLIGAVMPSILFEMAFISNRDEEKKLKDKKFRQKLADEMGGAVVKFLADQQQAMER